jgi:hypothetical protein
VRATPITHFTQVEPNAGREPTERTDVRIVVTSTAIVIGARMYDSNVRSMNQRLTRRDDNALSDRLTVTLDPFHNHRTAARFSVTPAGSLADATVGGRADGDPSWDPVWEAATAVDDSGWTAELRIPLSQLRYSTGATAWGLQIERFILRTQERDAFAFIPQTERGLVEHFGHLVGMSNLPGTRNLELLPYVSQRLTYLAEPNTNALVRARDARARIGGDLRYGVSSSLTLNASVNPDFGQVEVDPAVVNLTAFETVFPEKRPFFVEGTEFFEFGRIRSYNQMAAPQMFYSRRIGRAPQLAPPNQGSALATTIPDQTDILIASKLTGRSASGWSLGALHALTNEARGQSLLASGVSTGIAEPQTNFIVGRATRDLNDAATTIGAIATSVDRSLDDSSATRLRASSRVAGVDLHHAWGNRRWGLDGDFSVSSVQGSANAIALTQRSSTHYFQRPDRSDVRFDPTRTSLGGYAGQLAVTKLRGSWVGSLAYQDVSPGFEVNDIGLERLAGRHMLSTDFHYQSYKPGKLFNNFIVWPFTNHSWNYDGAPLKNPGIPTYNFWFQGQLRNFWNVVWWNGYTPRFEDDELTRGGASGLSPMARLYHAELRSSDRMRVSASLVAHTQLLERGSRQSSLSGGVSWRPAPNAVLRIDPTYSAERNPWQFIQRIGPASSMVAPVAGALFGELRRQTVSLDARADWTFTPRLTLQFYLQPFIDAGDYGAFAQLRTPRSLDYRVFGRDEGTVTKKPDNTFLIDPDGPGQLQSFLVANPDYTFRALRGNAVLRWEYRPGSTLYIVWQQQRGGQESFGDFRLSRDFTALGRLPTDNVFLIKGTYWLSF